MIYEKYESLGNFQLNLIEFMSHNSCHMILVTVDACNLFQLLIIYKIEFSHMIIIFPAYRTVV